MGISAFFKRLKGKKEESQTPEVPSAPKVPLAAVTLPAAVPTSASVEKVPAPAAIPVAKISATATATATAPVSTKSKTAPILTSPYALTGGAKNQSDWLLLQIGKTGRAFLAAADKAKLSVAQPDLKEGSFVRHDMTAALLGYRLVLTAYHLHQEVPSLEALRIVRTAMIGMLHRAVDIAVERGGGKEKRAEMLAAAEEQFKSADKQIMEACFHLRGKSPEAFVGFYPSLIPAFGFADTAHAHHERFGAVLKDLFARIESSMLARNHQITG